MAAKNWAAREVSTLLSKLRATGEYVADVSAENVFSTGTEIGRYGAKESIGEESVTAVAIDGRVNLGCK